MRELGWRTIGTLWGMPLRFHFSFPLGFFLVSGLNFRPGAWAMFVLLLLVHEAGHAWLVQRYGGTVHALSFHGLGAECSYEGAYGGMNTAKIAWGGVLAQAFVLVFVQVLVALLGTPSSDFFRDAALVSWQWNLFSIAFNLVPIRPLDGARAWMVFVYWHRRSQKYAPKEKPLLPTPTTPTPSFVDEQVKAEAERVANFDVSSTKEADELLKKIREPKV